MNFKGKFKKTLYQNKETNFAIMQYKCTDKDLLPPNWEHYGKGEINVTVCGNSLPSLHSEVVLNGEWIDNPKYGMQFQYGTHYVLVESDAKIIAEDLLSSKRYFHIGTRKAKKIANKFGEETFNIIKCHPQRLTEIAGITPAKANQIHEDYIKSNAFQETYQFLAPFGIHISTIEKIAEEYGYEAISKINEDPYCLIELDGIGLKTCDRIAVNLKRPLNNISRIIAGIEEAYYSLCNGGDMCCHEAELIQKAYQDLNDIQGEKLNITKEKIKRIFDMYSTERMGTARKFVIRKTTHNSYIYTIENDELERNVAVKLLQLSAKKVEIPEKTIRQSVTNYVANSPIKLSEKQQDAVVKSLSNKVSIITGGPGTGKTTIIKCIIQTYEKLFANDVICMAPTGKAAQRMSEATGKHARTIHSRLKLGDKKAKPEKIEKGLVIIDEVSMVDNALMSKVVDALNQNCSLIVVGDINQLPSVGSGDVLNQMLKSEVVASSMLTEVFRQKGKNNIVDNAYAINSGNTLLHYDDDFQFIYAKDEQQAIEKVKKIYQAECKKWGLAQVALLSPLRNNRTTHIKCVANDLNPILQNVANPANIAKPSLKANGNEYRLGDRVMQWKNVQDSANGDVGTIIKVSLDEVEENPYIEIQWDSGNIVKAYEKDLKTISLAYAMTVHKSQGSEYQSVIIPILSSQSGPIFKRNLLYTAVTRAKKKVILVGDINAINNCILQSDNNTRKTLLAARLRFNAKSILG